MRDQDPTRDAFDRSELVDYDALSLDEQAAVRAVWKQRLDEGQVDIAAEKRAAGLPYAIVDDTGAVVVVRPGGEQQGPDPRDARGARHG